MKKLFLSMACLAAMTVHAQNVSLVSSAEMDNRVPDSHGDRVLGSDASGHYILRNSGPITDSETIVEQYNADMKWVASIKIKGSTGDVTNAKMHRQTLLLDGKILTFHDRFSKADGATFCTVIPYEMSGEAQPEVALDKETAAGFFKTPTFSVALSDDGSKLVVLDEPVFEKGTMEKMRIKVFATNGFQELWSRDLAMDTESERYPDNDISVDNAGNAFVYKHVKVGPKDHLHQLIVANKAGSKTHKIDLQTYIPTEFKMTWDSDGSLLIGGMLMVVGQSATNWDRLWALKANADGIVYNKVMPISQTLLRGQLSEKLAAAPTARLNDCKLKAVLPRKSGGFFLVAEEFHSTKTVIGQTTPPTYEYALEFGGISVVAIDGGGKEIWTSFVPKKQNEKTMNEERYFGSVACHSANDKLHVVWNYTNWETLIGIPFRFWTDKTGTKINLDNLFGKNAIHPTMLTTLNADGSLEYKDWTFASYPLAEIQKTNAFSMAAESNISFPTNDGMAIMSRMGGAQWKKYKFTKIGL